MRGSRRPASLRDVDDQCARLTAARAASAPVNILAGPGGPSVAELAELGVARVSLGSSVAETAYAVVQRATEEALSTGTYTALTGALDYASLNALMRR